MPVAAIPFKSPAPFELPGHLVEALRTMPFTAAAEQVLAIMRDSGCADLIVVTLKDAQGRLSPGPSLATDPRHALIAQEIEAEIDQHAWTLDSEAGKGSFFGQAILGGQPLLMMGEVASNEPDPFPPSFRNYLLAGQGKANLGFLYVFPLQDEAGTAHGAIALHRSLPSGPLNHDQPAIVNALVRELGPKAAHPTA